MSKLRPQEKRGGYSGMKPKGNVKVPKTPGASVTPKQNASDKSKKP